MSEGPYAEFSKTLRACAWALLTPENIEQLAPGAQVTPDRLVINMLMLAMFDAVHDEWEGTYKRAGLEHEVAVARRLMKDAGYDYAWEPIVGAPGQKAPVCKIDGIEVIAYSHALAGMMPLSAYFTDKVRGSIEIAAMVGELVKGGAQQPAGATAFAPGADAVRDDAASISARPTGDSGASDEAGPPGSVGTT